MVILVENVFILLDMKEKNIKAISLRRNDLEVYSRERLKGVKYSIYKVKMDEGDVDEVLENIDLPILLPLSQYDGYPVFKSEEDMLNEEDTVFNIIMKIHYILTVDLVKLVYYFNTPYDISNTGLIKALNHIMAEGDIYLFNLELFRVNRKGLIKYFIFDRECEIDHYIYIEGVDMEKNKKIAIIEYYVSRLENAYDILKRTIEVLDLDSDEKEECVVKLKELKKIIKKIKKCRTIKELDKYVKVNRLLDHYKNDKEIDKMMLK